MPDYWCVSDRSLEKFFSLFRSRFACEEFLHDAENVWEWFEGKTSDGRLGFNFSRKHHMGEPLPAEPVCFRFTIYADDLDAWQLGDVLANAFQHEVRLGEIQYIDKDDSFSYRTDYCFTP